MSFSVNKLDVVFFQRNPENNVYEQVNISGSSVIFYIDDTGLLTASNITEFLQKNATTKNALQRYSRPTVLGETIYSVDTVTVGSPNRLTKYYAIPGSTQAFKISETETPTLDTDHGISIGKPENDPSVNATLDISGSEVITGSLTVTGGIYGKIYGSISSASYSSFSVTASYALNGGGGGGGTNLNTGSTYPITSSWSITSSFALVSSISFNSYTSSLSNYAISSSHSLTSDISYNSLSSSYILGSNVNGAVFASIFAYYASSSMYISGSNVDGPVRFSDQSKISTSSLFASSSVSSSYLSGSEIVVNNITASGNVVINGTLFASQLSSSQFYITSSKVVVGDNILTLNALTPHLQYAGIEVYDSGSTDQTSNLLWDGKNNYFFISSSDANYSRRIILGPNNEQSITPGYIPVVYDNNSLTNSIIYQSQSNVGINTTNPTSASFQVNGNIYSNSITSSIYLPISSSIQSDTSSAYIPPWQNGKLFWDESNHTYTIFSDISASSLQIGQESWCRVVAGEYIPNGNVVYISSSFLNIPLVYNAIAAGTHTEIKSHVIGVATHNISSGSQGWVTTNGIVHDINTSAYPAGSVLYLSDTTSGSYRITPPEEPYEKVIVGKCVSQNSSTGQIFVGITIIPDLSVVSVGAISVPAITTSSISNSGSIISIGTGSINFCTTQDGLGVVKAYTVPSASFILTSSYIDAQYIVANYNNGNPYYSLVTDRSNVDNIQSTLVYTVVNGADFRANYSDWDQPGILLSNKNLTRIQQVNGVQRENGLVLSESGSRYAVVTKGVVWQGVKQISLPEINSSVDRMVLLTHSASLWSGSIITQFNNTQCDDGTNLTSLGPGNTHWVVNYVYRNVGNLNSIAIQLSPDYSSVTDAISSQPPTPPPELKDFTVLIGRAIYKKSTEPAVQVDSAFTQQFTPAGITNHNLLNNLQGGLSPNEYYHLTLSEYTGDSGSSGPFLRKSGSYLYGTSSISVISYTSLYASQSKWTVSSSYASSSLSSSYSQISSVAYNLLSKTGSWYLPLSSSIQADTSTGNYEPPHQEGKLYWDYNDITYAIQNDASGVSLQIGQEQFIRVIAGENIYNGNVVYVSGSHGIGPRGNARPICKLALADGTGTKISVLGLATHNIPSGSAGWITVNGIVHDLNTSTFKDGDLVYLSSTQSGSVTNIHPLPPYETVKIGTVLVSDVSVGDIFVLTRPPVDLPVLLSSGLTSTPTITISGSYINIGTASVSLYNTVDGNDTLKNYFLPSASLNIPTTSSTYYITANYNNGNPIYALTNDKNTINQTTVVQVAGSIYPFYNGIEYIEYGKNGYSLSNKLVKRFSRTLRYGYESGLMLSESGSQAIVCTGGQVWFGADQLNISASNSGVTPYRLVFHTSPTTWSSSLYTSYNNTQYDNGSSLQTLTNNRYAVNFVYKSVANNYNNMYVVLGNGDFSLPQAQASQPPSNLPGELSQTDGLSVLVGRIIVQKGATTASQIDSAWVTLFTPSSTTDHNSLSNLQGGTAGEYYHLTNSQYTLLSNGTSSYSVSASFSNNSLTSSYPWRSTTNGVIDADGNVGINTNTPVTPLHIVSTGSANTVLDVLTLAGNQTGTNSTGAGVGIRFSQNSDGTKASIKFNEHNGNNGSQIRFLTQPSNPAGLRDVMCIDENARVGIGTTSSINTLDVIGNISCSIITASILTPNITGINSTLPIFVNTNNGITIEDSDIIPSKSTYNIGSLSNKFQNGYYSNIIYTDGAIGVGAMPTESITVQQNTPNFALHANGNPSSYYYKEQVNYNSTNAIQWFGIAGIELARYNYSLATLGLVPTVGNIAIATTASISPNVLTVNGQITASKFNGDLNGTALTSSYPWKNISGYTVNMGGNVGIGTISPGRNVEINQSGTGTQNIYLRLTQNPTDGAKNAGSSRIEGYYNDTANGEAAKIGWLSIEETRPGASNIGGKINLYTKTEGGLLTDDPTVKLTILPNGNTGIGTISPVNTLDVVGNISCSVITASLNGNANTSTSSSYANNGFISTLKLTQNINVLETVAEIPTGSNSSAFFDYNLFSGSNHRCGTVFGCWNGSTMSFTEYSTVDLGNTNQVTMSMDINGSNVRLLCVASQTNNWTIKTLSRYI